MPTMIIWKGKTMLNTLPTTPLEVMQKEIQELKGTIRAMEDSIESLMATNKKQSEEIEMWKRGFFHGKE